MTENTPYIIGIGPGQTDFVYPLAARLIEQAEVVIGGRRNLAELAKPGQQTMVIDRGLAEVAEYIGQNWQSRRLVVLASGDTSLFSVRAYLQKRLPEVPFAVLPGISSLQYLLAKRGLNLNELKIITLHGSNSANLLNTVMREKNVAIFTGGENSPQAIAGRLTALSFADLRLTVGENLSYPDERVVSGTPQEIAGRQFADLSLMLVENAAPENRPWPYLPAGLADELFCRSLGERPVPMTKSEVRAIINSKLRLQPGSRLLEVGAGTGSVTIEAALAAYEGHVWALEKNPEALAVCRANIAKFGLDNIDLLAGAAPEAIPDVQFDRVFIGGSGGNMAAIVAKAVAHSAGSLRLVISAITLESVGEAMAALQEQGCRNIEVVQAAVARSKPAGGKHLMLALNPITIISADFLRY